jgi:positive phototaxis protein PixI
MTTALSPHSTSPHSTTERLHEQSRRYLSVFLPGNHQALLPTDSLIEVLTFAPNQIVSIPDTPAQVMGVCNWRGEVLWLVDAGHLLTPTPSFRDTNYQTKFNVVVLKQQSQTLGLVVERVGNMIWCHPSEIQRVQAATGNGLDNAPIDNMATRCLAGSWLDPTGQALLVMDALAILNLFSE